MTALNFPSSPTNGQTYTDPLDGEWVFDGVAWNRNRVSLPAGMVAVVDIPNKLVATNVEDALQEIIASVAALDTDLQNQITSNDATDASLQAQITALDADLQAQITANDATDVLLQDQITSAQTQLDSLESTRTVGALPPVNPSPGHIWLMTPLDHSAMYTTMLGWTPIYPQTSNQAVVVGNAMLGVEGLWVSEDGV